MSWKLTQNQANSSTFNEEFNVSKLQRIFFVDMGQDMFCDFIRTHIQSKPSMNHVCNTWVQLWQKVITYVSSQVGVIEEIIGVIEDSYACSFANSCSFQEVASQFC